MRRFMNSNPIVVKPSLDLLHWVEEFVYRYHHRAFPVASNGHLEGFVTTEALSRIPRGEWAEHTVGEVMAPDLQAVSITADTDALKALGKMQHTGSSRLLVTDGDHLLGIVSLKDLLRFLSLKLGTGRDRRAADGMRGRIRCLHKLMADGNEKNFEEFDMSGSFDRTLKSDSLMANAWPLLLLAG